MFYCWENYLFHIYVCICVTGYFRYTEKIQVSIKQLFWENLPFNSNNFQLILYICFLKFYLLQIIRVFMLIVCTWLLACTCYRMWRSLWRSADSFQESLLSLLLRQGLSFYLICCILEASPPSGFQMIPIFTYHKSVGRFWESNYG